LALLDALYEELLEVRLTPVLLTGAAVLRDEARALVLVLFDIPALEKAEPPVRRFTVPVTRVRLGA